MKFSLVSDLHLDFEGIHVLLNAYNEGVKTLVMAGDIVEATLLRDKTAKADRIREYLSLLNDMYDNVIWVMGNHEHYGNSFVHTHQNLKSRAKENHWTNFHVLEKETLEVDDTIFFGATMWTSFRNGNPLSMNECQLYMSDYSHIHVGKAAYGETIKLTTMDTAAVFKRTLIELKKFAELKTDKKKVVVTHMAPSHLSLDPTYRGSRVNDAYYEDMSEFILDSDINLFCHGHIHAPCDYMIGNTRVVSNPRGYYGHESQANNYIFKMIET